MTDAFTYMVSAGVLDTEQAARVQAHMAAHQVNAPKAAVELGFISADDGRKHILAASGIPAVTDLASVRCDPEALALVPRAKARRWEVVPMRFDGTTLVLAVTMHGYNSQEVRDDLRLALAGRPFAFEVAPTRDLRAKLDAEYRNELELATIAEQVTDGAGGGDAAVRMVELTLDQAIADRASDIHIEPGAGEVFVRYRIDGVLIDKPSIPKSIQDSVVARLKILSNMDIAEQRIPQDGRLSRRSRDGRKIDMRVSSLPTVNGEKVVLRILDNSATRQTLGEFAFTEENSARWLSAATKPSGLMLVTGPTGSGKSTTLYATLNEVSRPEVNIVTVEDPVEYAIPRINQVQVNPKAGLTFASALRSILRQDPDIILLGEIRDHETAQIAIEAALTGHLVLSTLHTNNSPEAATRLAEMGVEGFLVGSVLECVLAQRLVRRLCIKCRRQYEPHREELETLGFYAPPGVTPTFYEAVGCPSCANTGYRGRLAVHETMIRTPHMEKLISTGATVDLVAAQALKDGMVPMKGDGWAKVAAGWTTIPEVLRVVS